MVLPVAVEIAPPDSPKESVAVLLAACTRAKRGGECVLAADVAGNGTSAVAIVTWQGNARALVEVGLRREGHPEWRTRTLEFDPNRDDLLERWRAVGFVVGTLANEETPSAESEPERTPKPQESAPPKAPAEKAKRGARDGKATELESSDNEVAESTGSGEGTRSDEGASTRYEPMFGRARGRLDVGASIGPAFDEVRFGGLVRAEVQLPDPLRAQITLRYLERPSGAEELRAQWITMSAGLGVGFGGERIEFGVALDGRAEYFAARAERRSAAEADTRWLGGIGAGTTLAWMPSATFGFFAGADLALMFGSTDVRVESRSLGTDGMLRYAGEGGIRFRLR
jgi:hypothetical protein